jgi:hypothetical protein
MIPAAVLIVAAFLILPWLPLILLTYYETPEHVYATGDAYITETITQKVGCQILLTTHGPISALNPLTVKIDVITATVIPTLETILGFSKVQAFLPHALPFPYSSANYLWSYAIVDLHRSSYNSWSGSQNIVYPSSGNFDVTIQLQNATGWILRQVFYNGIISIASSEITFSYVTSLVFVSLELVIVGLMVYEVARDIGRYKEKCYTKTN